MDRGKFVRIKWTDYTWNKYADGNTDGTKRRRKYRYDAKKYWNHLRTLDIEIKSEIKFLKNQLLAKDTFLRDEIMFLRRQLSEALTKKGDTSTYLSSSP